MRLVPVPVNQTLAGHTDRLRLGRFVLGRCLNPDRGAECHPNVSDDGRGFADLDGKPFAAYVCALCAARLPRALFA